MCINGDGGLAERLVQDDIGGFTANAGQLHQLISRLRDIAAEIVDDHLAERDDVFGFIAPEADGFDVGLDAFKAEREHFFWRIGNLEQVFGRFIDANISGLRRKSDGDDECVRVDEVELCVRVGAVLGEAGIEDSRFLFTKGRGCAFAFRFGCCLWFRLSHVVRFRAIPLRRKGALVCGANIWLIM